MTACNMTWTADPRGRHHVHRCVESDAHSVHHRCSCGSQLWYVSKPAEAKR